MPLSLKKLQVSDANLMRPLQTVLKNLNVSTESKAVDLELIYKADQVIHMGIAHTDIALYEPMKNPPLPSSLTQEDVEELINRFGPPEIIVS